MINVLCLSFANENEIRMGHDLLLNVHGYLDDVRAKSRRLVLSDNIRTKIRRHLCEILIPG